MSDIDPIEHFRDESDSVMCSAESCESAGEIHILTNSNDECSRGFRGRSDARRGIQGCHYSTSGEKYEGD